MGGRERGREEGREGEGEGERERGETHLIHQCEAHSCWVVMISNDHTSQVV